MLVSANIFQPLIDVFHSVLLFFHNSVGVSWGWSIVLLTISVRIVLLPLGIKQYSSMRKMQHSAPRIKAIQAKYKDDKARQQEEMMKFYREEGINPLASCLPLAAQFPVLISLFYMLRTKLRVDICPHIQTLYQTTYAHAHNISLVAAAGQTRPCGPVPAAGFLFIKDITDQAHGATLVILLVLYVGTQLLSSMLMSQPTMDKSQRRMMMFLPVVFVVFIIRFPAGLLVYWITTNLWTMGQQYTLKRLAGAPPIAPVIDETPAPARRSGGSGRGGSSTSSGNGKSPDSGGSSGGTGLGARLRGITAKPADGGSGNGGGAPRTPAVPPQPPRKKKKRSGRRR